MRTLLVNLLVCFSLCTSVYMLYACFGTEFSELYRWVIPQAASSLWIQSSGISPKTFGVLLDLPASRTPHFGEMVRPHNHSAVGDQDDTVRENENDLSEGSKKRMTGTPSGGLFQDQIYWSESLESLLPSTFTEYRARLWREKVRGYQIVSLMPGCGRPSNRLAVFPDGTKACVRYGINADQVQGETLSYYLAGLLGIPNLPPLVISQVNPVGEQWAAVKDSIEALQWTVKAVVSLTEWVANLTGVVTPVSFRQGRVGLRPVEQDLRNRTVGELLELMEWTDLITFDFLTANFDRLVSSLFSLQWDSRVMERNISNLHRTPSGRLLFIDNEAGLVHGYRVLHMWEKYHKTVLGSVCVFRKETAHRVAELHRMRNIREKLMELINKNEPLAPELGFLSDEHAVILQNRIDTLYRHMQHCKEKYNIA